VLKRSFHVQRERQVSLNYRVARIAIDAAKTEVAALRSLPISALAKQEFFGVLTAAQQSSDGRPLSKRAVRDMASTRGASAPGGNRTRTPLRATDFKSVASAVPPPGLVGFFAVFRGAAQCSGPSAGLSSRQRAAASARSEDSVPAARLSQSTCADESGAFWMGGAFRAPPGSRGASTVHPHSGHLPGVARRS
jgi:hypothetical protein